MPERLVALLPGFLLGAVFAATMLAGCGDSKDEAGGASGQRPPPAVGVIAARAATVALETELPGRVEPIRIAQVRARVSGVILHRLFREGANVKAGQPLFQIDPSPYEAALQSAQAALGKAEANLAQAKAQAGRYEPLAAVNAVSQQEYTNVIAAHKQALADVSAAQAALRVARINTDYARVRAPISGRIGRALVTEGALASAQEATHLATIQQTDTVYLNVTQSANELQALRRSHGAGTRLPASVPVSVILDDGSELPHEGRLLFSDLTVDPTSGQVLLRAQIPNPDNMLLPGQYVRVRVTQATLPNAMLIPQQGVNRSDKGDTVQVVGAGNKPETRPVKVGGQHDGNWIVLDGLKEGERVIVDGFQKMTVPGAPVTPVPWSSSADTPAISAK